jgi:hypothetical protein
MGCGRFDGHLLNVGTPPLRGGHDRDRGSIQRIVEYLGEPIWPPSPWSTPRRHRSIRSRCARLERPVPLYQSTTRGLHMPRLLPVVAPRPVKRHFVSRYRIATSEPPPTHRDRTTERICPLRRITFRPPNHRPARTMIHCPLTTRIEIPILWDRSNRPSVEIQYSFSPEYKITVDRRRFYVGSHTTTIQFG